MSSDLLISWTSFPLVDNLKKSAILVSFIIFISAIVWYITFKQWNSPIFFYIGMALLIFELLPYFVPTTYYLNDNTILIKYPLAKVEKKYSEYGCFYYDKNGIMLSPFSRPHRLDRFRGQSLRFSADKAEKDEVINILKTKIGAQF